MKRGSRREGYIRAGVASAKRALCSKRGLTGVSRKWSTVGVGVLWGGGGGKKSAGDLPQGKTRERLLKPNEGSAIQLVKN